MNETLKTIEKRYSCRNFNGVMPDAEALDAIAMAAIQAPSGMNRQPWQVIVIKNKSILSDMEAEGMNVLSQMADKSMYERIMARGGKLFYNAPCMIMLAIKEAQPKGAELIDCGIIAQNIALAATSLGIANLHCGFAVLAFAAGRASEFKSRLNFADGYECGIGVLLGYSDNAASPHEPNRDKITIVG